MDWLFGLGALVLVIATAPLWPLILRSTKSHRGGALGGALGEMNAVFDPSQRHGAKVAEERRLERRSDEPPTL